MKNKIIFLHPAIRLYRVLLFNKLNNKLKVLFYWTALPNARFNCSSHEEREISSILNNSNIDYIQAKEFRMMPIANLSWGLFKLPFMGYNIYIFSGIVSIPSIILIPILKILRKKIIVFDELWRYPKEVSKYRKIYPYVRFLTKYCLDGVIAAGSKAKDFYISELGFDEKKVEIAYNTTIDTKEYVEDNKINQITKNKISKFTAKKRILYLGRIVKYKGLDVLIEAMKYINEEYDLIIVGKGEFRSYCENLTQELNLNSRIHFLGGCLSNEAPYFYKNSDIFVLPTRFMLDENVQMESWGFTVNEAMALEIPVITTTAVGAGFDLVIDGITGGLAEAGDVESLAKKINFIINNNQNNKIGKKAREHLLSICNYDDNYRAYKAIINKVLSG